MCEDQELQRRIPPIRPAPDPDQEEHREQDEFPEHCEQDEVEGLEYADEGHLEEQEEPEERPRSVFLVPVEHDCEGREERRQPNERHAEPVDADDIVEPELRPPPLPLYIVQGDGGRGNFRDWRSDQPGPARLDERSQEERRQGELDEAETKGGEL